MILLSKLEKINDHVCICVSITDFSVRLVPSEAAYERLPAYSVEDSTPGVLRGAIDEAFERQ